MVLKYSIICLMLVFGFTAQAQKVEEDHHDEHQHEIGVANAPVYFMKEESFSYGLHVHYIYSISDTKFGLGLGYERIFDEHKHNTIGLVACYRPIDPLSFNISPGVTYEGKKQKEMNFALHIETS